MKDASFLAMGIDRRCFDCHKIEKHVPGTQWNKIMGYLCIIFLLTSCTFSISVVDTHGQAEDVVDTQQEPQNDIKPTLDLSLTPGV